MVVPRDEISLFIREWYYAASEGQTERFLGFFLPDERTTYFGTDPQEIWRGYGEIKAGIEENFRTYGKWTIMSKHLTVHQVGDLAIFADEVEFSAALKESSVAEDARVSGVLLRQNGEWKILQAHLSFGIPNDQLLPG